MNVVVRWCCGCMWVKQLFKYLGTYSTFMHSCLRLREVLSPAVGCQFFILSFSSITPQVK